MHKKWTHETNRKLVTKPERKAINDKHMMYVYQSQKSERMNSVGTAKMLNYSEPDIKLCIGNRFLIMNRIIRITRR